MIQEEYFHLNHGDGEDDIKSTKTGFLTKFLKFINKKRTPLKVKLSNFPKLVKLILWIPFLTGCFKLMMLLFDFLYFSVFGGTIGEYGNESFGAEIAAGFVAFLLFLFMIIAYLYFFYQTIRKELFDEYE